HRAPCLGGCGEPDAQPSGGPAVGARPVGRGRRPAAPGGYPHARLSGAAAPRRAALPRLHKTYDRRTPATPRAIEYSRSVQVMNSVLRRGPPKVTLDTALPVLMRPSRAPDGL